MRHRKHRWFFHYFSWLGQIFMPYNVLLIDSVTYALSVKDKSLRRVPVKGT